ncbi:aldo/keto reductase [Desulfosarcina sp.]|uniref:aldo/keto reductase n=1 Tax=Desulfosarcina sp. TaxID=2027861 RepID=UPI003970619C
MNNATKKISRRTFIIAIGALTAGSAIAPRLLWGEERKLNQHPIPSSRENLPVIGMGTSRTFDVGADAGQREELAKVLSVFFDNGGKLIDSSPMYGTAEAVMGDLLEGNPDEEKLFAATKVWTDGREAGMQQMERSMQRMGVRVMDLMQIHNLRDWHTHLPVLREWKQAGRIRYIGITTSHGRFHSALEQIMRTEQLDFVQLSYNLADREAESRLLPLAADRGIATLINRPFQRGELFRSVKGRPLPPWSADFDCDSWGRFFLKYVASHPAVTCVIPATSKAHHMLDNMGAGFGRMPDAGQRRLMEQYFHAL